ncbi:hypothetical protein [Luteimonas huabeiensis]|uniref:hypothetical protein n=1 Tax=Luteimonas huabeiensis TaxID=1244513 RepID=UPI00046589F9|nr:hypothetical protein [Luteimonas huabeiensis]
MQPILVLGTAGALGRGIVEAALEAGQPVLAVADDACALDALRRGHPGGPLHTRVARLASEPDAARLARRLRALGYRPRGVIAALGGEGACGRLLDQPADVLRRTLDEDLLPHLAAARHLFGLLPRETRPAYVLVGGPGASYPWAGYGHRSIAAAALRMLARVLHEEARREGVDVHLLSVDAPVRTPENCAHASEAWPQARAVGRRALALVDAPAAARGRAVIPFVPRPLTSTEVEVASSAAAPDARAWLDRLLSSPTFRNPSP